METKTCSKCDEEMPVTAFHRNKATRDGHHTVCKPCRRIYATFMTDHEAKRANARRTYEFNKGYIKAKRVLFRLLMTFEFCEDQSLGLQYRTPPRHIQSTVDHFVPEKTVLKVEQLLRSHLGADTYWSGYGTRWCLMLAEKPDKLHLASPKGDLQSVMRRAMRPDNISFHSFELLDQLPLL